MSDFKRYIEINRESWNKRTPIHIKSKFYNNSKFKKEINSLNSIEVNAIGDIKEKTILHLQCHFGQDSISLAKMGAKVTAVDFSDIAIEEAKKISKETNINVDFIKSNILELDIDKQFDIIFTSYGVLGWLPDLNKWGRVISKHLKKGGFILLTEFHPFLELIKDEGYDYFYSKSPDIGNNGTYTDGGEKLTTNTCWWNHSLTSIFTALESNGLKLKLFEEFDYSPYLLEGMVKTESGKHKLKERKNLKLPYVYNLKAIKK